MEQTLVESKLLSATLDMENDKLVVDLKRKNEVIKKYAERVTNLETEIVQVKEYLGQTANSNENEEDENASKRGNS